jgi:hypothetical protein
MKQHAGDLPSFLALPAEDQRPGRALLRKQQALYL